MSTSRPVGSSTGTLASTPVPGGLAPRLGGRALLAAVALAALIAPGAASAARVKVAAVTASSSYPSDENANYEPKNLTDGKSGTSWVEGDQGGGLGSWVELDLGGSKTVKRIQVWGGMWYSSEYWARGNRPKALEVKFSDGTVTELAMSDTQAVQVLDLPKAVSTTNIRFKVKSVYNGSTWQDTAISEIQVFDDGPADDVRPNTIVASTTAPADGDGNYEAMNVADGLVDTMWCEGSKDGDGTNETLTLDFGSQQSVSKLNLVNGMGTSMSMFMKANKATAATLTFSDGSTAPVTIKASVMPQVVTFPAKTTSSVKITFTGISKGKEFNDLCISEAYFQ